MNQKTKKKLVELKLEAELNERYFFNRLMESKEKEEYMGMEGVRNDMWSYFENRLAESKAYLRGVNDMLKILNLKK